MPACNSEAEVAPQRTVRPPQRTAVRPPQRTVRPRLSSAFQGNTPAGLCTSQANCGTREELIRGRKAVECTILPVQITCKRKLRKVAVRRKLVNTGVQAGAQAPLVCRKT